ncbi:MAG: FMN-binding protein [Rhodospirillaceae bacterium]|nr:FMN-binding protein [Rhodospirillaceae bacterium]
MRYQFMMFPAAIVASISAQAEDFLTVDKAQQLIFPGATFTPSDLTLSEAQVDQLIQLTNATVFRSRVKAWKVSTGGWFFLDQVPGRDDRITYAIGLNDDGSVKGIEILVCVASYDGVRQAGWRSQFQGKLHADGPNLANQIANITGTTLSVEHIAEGVKRVLATHALFIANKTG